jgi:hypothetical protein
MYNLIHTDSTQPAFVETLKEAKELEILRFNPYFSVVYPIDLINVDLTDEP